VSTAVQIAPRGRSPEYIEIADRLSRKPGKCKTCGETLIGFVAGDVDDSGHEAISASIHAWFRFGCPFHDIYVWEMLGEHEGHAALRHESDPAWSWAPLSWRPALARAGWGLPNLFAYPSLLVGEAEGRIWITDRKNLIAFPEGTTLAQAEEGIGLRVIAKNEKTSARETAAERKRHRLGPKQIDPLVALDGYVVGTQGRPPSALGWPAGWDESCIAIGETVLPLRVLLMVGEFYPGTVWHVRGWLEAARGVDPAGNVVASVMPANVAESEGRMAMEEAAEAEVAKPCPKCKHEHSGAYLGYICIGCPCEWRPAALGRAQAFQDEVCTHAAAFSAAFRCGAIGGRLALDIAPTCPRCRVALGGRS
jgi:hypothetical protein